MNNSAPKRKFGKCADCGRDAKLIDDYDVETGTQLTACNCYAQTGVRL